MPGVLDALFPDGRPLAFRSRVGSRSAATHWLRPMGELPDGQLALESLLEIDGRRRRGALVCRRDGAPVLYRVLEGGRARAFGFGADDIVLTLPEGRARLPRAGAEFVAEAFAAGFTALMLIGLGDRLAAPVRTARFHVTQLAVAPCTLTRTGDRIVTSHDEEMTVDGTGLLLAIDRARDGITAERCDAPLPAWADEEDAIAPRRVYQPPPGVRVEDVVVAGDLGGTLSLPEGELRTPAPAALFLPGTGRPDRHGILGGIDAGSHDIMDGLARHGIVGLRCDVRPANRLADLVAGAAAQLDFLAAHPRVDPRRIFLVGHSQGGAVALGLAAARPEAVRGAVLLAATGRPFAEVVADQIRRIGAAQGWPAHTITGELEDLEQLVAAAVAGRPLIAGEVPDRLMLRTIGQAWLADRIAERNTERLRTVRCPVLVCQGDADVQVTSADAEALLRAGREGGVAITLAMFDGLDHWFQHAGTVDELVPRRIAAWIEDSGVPRLEVDAGVRQQSQGV